jgi:DNA repair protein RadC
MAREPDIFIPLKRRRPEEQPRERLARHGVEHLRTSELIALIVRTGSSGKSAVDIGEQLLQRYQDDLTRISRLDLKEICAHPGFGTASGCALLAAFELGRRVHYAGQADDALDLKRVSDVAAMFRREYGTDAPEKFAAFYINRQYRLLGTKLISRGSTAAAVVDPRDIFKEALLLNASAVILAHNHPGGDVEPSTHDLDLTRQLADAGRIFRIPVAEHVIVAQRGEKGFLDEVPMGD